jgi:uracil-DNA glycosylase family 4
MGANPTNRTKEPSAGPGRALMQKWLEQKIDAREAACVVPDSGADRVSSKSSTLPAAASKATKSTSATESTMPAQKSPAQKLPVRKSVGKTAAASKTVASTSAVVDSVQRIAAEVSACTRCRLHETRDKSVPGVGPDDANLVFIGEGPGAQEDSTGEPFVGRAGQLLTKIIAAVNFQRDEVFITNIVKCRPPNNRDPKPDEIEACEPYLKRQLRALDPKVICTLGRHAAMTLLQTKESMAKLRTGEHSYEGVRLFPTYHPAALLRNPQWKRPVWEDIQNVRKAYDEPRQKT